MDGADFRALRAGPIDWELLFCSHVLGLPALHWGCWKAGEALNLENLRLAQRRFTRRVFDAVLAESPRNVLDVGCGRGDGAALLADQGVQVTAIEPIANYRSRLLELADRGVRFEMTRFEDFETSEQFDVVAMSESCGYFTAEATFARGGGLLHEGGALVVANMFRLTPVRQPLGKHVLGEFVSEGRRHGFVVVREDDITAEVLPTLALYRRWCRRHALPAIDYAEAFARSRAHSRAGSAAVAALMRPVARQVRESLARYARRFDPEAFAAQSCYRILTFERQ